MIDAIIKLFYAYEAMTFFSQMRKACHELHGLLKCIVMIDEGKYIFAKTALLG